MARTMPAAPPSLDSSDRSQPRPPSEPTPTGGRRRPAGRLRDAASPTSSLAQSPIPEERVAPVPDSARDNGNDGEVDDDRASVASSDLDVLWSELEHDLAATSAPDDVSTTASDVNSTSRSSDAVLSRPPTAEPERKDGVVIALKELEGSGLEVQTTAVLSQVFLVKQITEGPYNGARLSVWLKVYPDYPARGPSVRLMTLIFHPNVAADGTFGEFETVQEACAAIHSLQEPTRHPTRNDDAAQLLGTDAFTRVVKQTLKGGTYGGEKYCRAIAQPAHAWPKQLDGKTKKLFKEVEVAATEAKRFADNAIRWNTDELEEGALLKNKDRIEA